MNEFILTVENTKTKQVRTVRELLNAKQVKVLMDNVGKIGSDGVNMLTKIEPVNVDYAKEFLNSLTPKPVKQYTFYNLWRANAQGYTNQGSFLTSLLNTYRLADSEGQQRLNKVYPEYFINLVG